MTTPKASRNKAQGRDARTLTTPYGLRSGPVFLTDCNFNAYGSLRNLFKVVEIRHFVSQGSHAMARQPWALMRNPFGMGLPPSCPLRLRSRRCSSVSCQRSVVRGRREERLNCRDQKSKASDQSLKTTERQCLRTSGLRDTRRQTGAGKMPAVLRVRSRFVRRSAQTCPHPSVGFPLPTIQELVAT